MEPSGAAPNDSSCRGDTSFFLHTTKDLRRQYSVLGIQCKFRQKTLNRKAAETNFNKSMEQFPALGTIAVPTPASSFRVRRFCFRRN